MRKHLGYKEKVTLNLCIGCSESHFTWLWTRMTNCFGLPEAILALLLNILILSELLSPLLSLNCELLK